MQQLLNYRTNEYEQLVLTCNQYEICMVDEGELRYNGKMYDIQSVEINGDIVNIKALQDQEEDRIINRLRKFFEQTDDEDLPDTIVNLLTMDYIIPATPDFYYSSVLTGKTFIVSRMAICSRETDVSLPPPRI